MYSPASSKDAVSYSPPKVLIVDDEVELTQILSEMLANSGYEAHGEHNALRAIDLLQQEAFDIVLVDLMMPDMDGITLLQKAFEVDPNMVGIVMTGRGTVQSAIEAMRIGAYDYIQKPFKLDAVLTILTRALALRRLRIENVHLRDLLSVYELGQTVGYTLDREEVLRKTVQAALQQSQANEASVQLFREQDQSLEIVRVEGGERKHLLGVHVPLDGPISGWVAQNRETLILPGEVQDPRFHPVKPRSDIRFAVSMPMTSGNRLVGVINVNLTKPSTMTQGQIKGLSLLVNFAASALENARLFDSLQDSNRQLRSAYDATIEGWSHALDLRDHETEGHTQRVTELTLRLARAMGVDELEHIRWGALLHDIGKVGVPDTILLKKGVLDPGEVEVMRKHPEYAYQLLAPIEYLGDAIDIPYAHHERWDGKGYPRGLKAEEIPLVVRIFSVIDVWDALRSDRPYRPRWSRQETLDYIRSESGKRFDPSVVYTFLKMVEEEKL